MHTPPLTRALPQLSTPRRILRLVGLELGGLGRRVRHALGGEQPVPLDSAQLEIPDSVLALAATKIAHELEPDYVFNHSVRTYLFGVAIAHHMDLKPDRELLYLAAILHDLGLMPEHASKGDFELDSARAAHQLVLERGLDPQRAALVHEAIALHTSAGIAGSREPEVALTHFGAGLDVIGVRREHVAHDTREAIVDAWPRADFKTKFSALLRDHVAHRPHCHIAGYMRLGFTKKIQGAPFTQ